MRVARRIALGLLALGLLSTSAALAEISASRTNGSHARTLIMGDTRVGITDGADPVLSVPWDAYRAVNSFGILNSGGAIRPDGRPDLVFHPAKQWPIVVWAYNNGPDHDIAFAEWTGNGWGQTRMLTAGPEDEVDPRVFVNEAGVIYVTWWVNVAEPYVMLTSRRLAAPDWEVPVRITAVGEFAVRPTVAQASSTIWVAYERVSAGSLETLHSRELVVRRRTGNDAFAVEQVLSAQESAVLDPVLDFAGARLHLTWRNSADSFGCSVWSNAGWGEPFYLPLPDPSWLGFEMVRIQFNRAVQNLPDTTPADPGDLGGQSETSGAP